jgi:phenylpyruvate tautomerase PptA (4-oxalocrotonate tautomerase family)
MGGRGETVKYTKKFYKQALTDSEKKQLIADITSIITNSTSELTIIAFAKEED